MSDSILSDFPSAVICRTATKCNGILAGRVHLYRHITSDSDVEGLHNEIGNIIFGVTLL